ncbi:mechanosensitive ion channel family protein [Nocardioides sp.]|uniref:mechanosensitive ion channel family protein n=1 Tax=Nocardioides sp. TaxID=35761 RepID=UPI0035663ECB
MDDELFAGLTVGQLLVATGILVLGVVAASLVRRVVVRAFRGGDSDPEAAQLLGRFLQVLALSAVVLYILKTLGIEVTPLLGALGIGGIAVALAVQSVLSNAIASIILQVRRPFRRGDQIATNDLEGRVVDINLRTVRLVTFDGNDVVVPASKVLEAPITNYTRGEARRTELVVGVDYETDLDAARQLMIRAAAGVGDVHDEPGPEAWVYEFGDSTINVALRFWHHSPNAVLWRVRSEVAVAVKRDLDAAGVVIAFPQRVLHLAPEANLLRTSVES